MEDTNCVASKMINFAKDIAYELGIDGPDFDDFEDTSLFIEEYKGDYYKSIADMS